MLLRIQAVERERYMIPGRLNERIGPGDGEEDSERWSGTGCLVGVCVGQREEEWVVGLVGVEGEIGKIMQMQKEKVEWCRCGAVAVAVVLCCACVFLIKSRRTGDVADMYGVPSSPLARWLRCDQGQLRKRLEKARNGGRPWARKARQSLDHGPCNTAISSSLHATSAPQHGAPRIRPSN
jgi:hypothetical protein